MNPTDTLAPRHSRAWRLPMLLVAALVAHAVLQPWQFEAPASWPDALAALLAQHIGWPGRAQALGAAALFMPLGLLWVASVGGLRRAGLRSGLVLIGAGVGFAFGLQVLRLCQPDREASLASVLWNAIGLGGGVLGGALLLGMAGRVRAVQRAPLLLIGLWLALQAYPFRPAFDVQQAKDALRPLLLDPAWSTREAIDAALALTVVGHLLRGWPLRALWLLGLAGAAVLAAVGVAGHVLTMAHACGLAAGLLAAAFSWRWPERPMAKLLVGAVLLWFTVYEMLPFEWAEHASRFRWMPFAALQESSRAANLLSLAGDLFWLGAPMVLAATLGARLAMLAIGLALWALALEGMQTVLPDRQADVTVALLPLLWAVLLALLVPAPPPATARRRRRRSRRGHLPAALTS